MLISVALVLSISLCAIPANAIEIDAPTIGTVTSMEDMMRMAENYVSPTGLYQGDKQYCYLVLLRANTAGITKVSGNLTYNAAFSTVECAASKAITDTSRPDIFSFGRESVNELGSKFLSFSSKSEFTAPDIGADILEYRLQSTEYSDPQRINVSYRSTFGDYSQSNTGATVSKILMGDADGDGQVSSSDALLILQAAGGKTTITGDNAIAADIDRDGKIVASDALAVLQYTTNDLTTFWNHGIISTEENEKIVSGKIYRMRCVDTDKNLKIPTSGGAVLSDYERTKNDYKFKFTYLGNGLYKIAEKADNTLVLTAGAGTVKFATYNSSNAGQKWYVNSKGGDDFYLSPLSAKYTFLTSSGTTSAEHGYNINGGIWRVYGAEVTIYNYYDNSYVKRHASSGVTPQDYISDCQAKLNAVLESVFDLKVINGNTPTLMQSYVDQCTELDPDDLDSYCNRGPTSECSGETDDDKKDFTKGHHTSFLKNIEYFEKDFIANNKMKEIRSLSIGHTLCVYNYKNNGLHVACWAGLSSIDDKSPCIAMANVTGDNRFQRHLEVMLHEQSHQLGALDTTTNGKTDHNHGECIMSYNRTSSTMSSYFGNETQYGNLYCNICKQAIKTYIDNSL